MPLKNKLNQVLLLIILLLAVAIFTFNWGYNLGEHKGYVEGMQWCLEGQDQLQKQKTQVDIKMP